MRYFIHLAYNGSNYAGWQRQPHSNSVQETLEAAMSTILGAQALEITGCGRTDTGVHAAGYYAHFDWDGNFPEGFLNRLNKFLPPGIAVYELLPVPATAHARFDATYRAYRYQISLRKDPFRTATAYHFPFADRTNPDLMQEAARLLLDYELFQPFCKTGSDAKTMACQLFRSEWDFQAQEWTYYIAANRFLRGMVRLIVGMCLNVGMGKLSLAQVQAALDQQTLLPKSQSAPPQGLYLYDIHYPADILGAKTSPF